MDALREILEHAQAAGVAIGHFNVADLVLLKAVFAAARQQNDPVLVGASEGEREFAGTRQLGALAAQGYANARALETGEAFDAVRHREDFRQLKWDLQAKAAGGPAHCRFQRAVPEWRQRLQWCVRPHPD
jgi:hypothetical protein